MVSRHSFKWKPGCVCWGEETGELFHPLLESKGEGVGEHGEGKGEGPASCPGWVSQPMGVTARSIHAHADVTEGEGAHVVIGAAPCFLRSFHPVYSEE